MSNFVTFKMNERLTVRRRMLAPKNPG